MDDPTMDKARELGRLLGRSPEYQALTRARGRIDEDRELTALLRRMGELESQVARALEGGREPSPETAEAYDSAFGELQSNSLYQALASAQSNFDKVLAKVNDEIGKGMDEGGRSRIILP